MGGSRQAQDGPKRAAAKPAGAPVTASHDRQVRILDERWAILELDDASRHLPPDALADLYDRHHDGLKAHGITLIGFDLTRCPAIGSSLLAALILAVAPLAGDDPYLLVLDSPLLIRQLQAMGIADRVRIHPTVDAAIESLPTA